MTRLFKRGTDSEKSSRSSTQNQKQTNKVTANYPIRRIGCRVLSIPRGFPTATPDNIFLGQTSKRKVLGLVDTEAYNGSYAINPFDFKNHNLTQVGRLSER